MRHKDLLPAFLTADFDSGLPHLVLIPNMIQSTVAQLPSLATMAIEPC